jgi:ribosome biogenesis GTPase
LVDAFADVSDLAIACRFADCRHVGEPGCAVQAAIDAGDLPVHRLESWRKLRRELAREARRRAARLKRRPGVRRG